MQDFKLAPAQMFEWATTIISNTSQATVVKSGRDWQVVYDLFMFWYKRWPDEAKPFIKNISLIRSTRRNRKAQSSSGEIEYTAALPPKLMRLIKIVFPKQQFDKKFIYRLCLKMPIFKISRY